MDTERHKRQRIFHACDTCRKKKIKCDGAKPACSNCMSSKNSCAYSETIRNPSLPKRKKSHVKELESRLEKIEYMLESLLDAISGEKDDVDSGRKTAKHMVSKKKVRHREEDVDEEEEEGEEDSEQSEQDEEEEEGESSDTFSDPDSNVAVEGDCNLLKSSYLENLHKEEPLGQSGISDRYSITTLKKGNLFVGNSVFSVFSPRGMNWIDSKSGGAGSRLHLANSLKNLHGTNQDKSLPFVNQVGEGSVPLEKWAVDIALAVFQRGPSIWRLILPTEQLEKLVRAEFDEPYKASIKKSELNGFSEVAALYTVVSLAFGMIAWSESLRKEMQIDFERVKSIVYGYSSSAFNHLMKVNIMMGPSLMALQSCLLLVISFHHADAFHPAAQVVLQARSICSDLGFYRADSLAGLSPESRKLVSVTSWMTIIFECDITLKCGRGTSFLGREITMPYPPVEDVVLERGKATVLHLLRWTARFFYISSKIYAVLATASASDTESVFKVVSIMDGELEEWRLSIPEWFRPGDEGEDNMLANDDELLEEVRKLEPIHEDSFRIVSMLYLNCCYYHVLIDMNRLIYQYKYEAALMKAKEKSSAQQEHSDKDAGIYTPLSSSSPASHHNPQGWNSKRLSKSGQIALDAARRTIKLVLRYHFWGRYFLWGPFFHASNSLIALFISVLSNPRGVDSESDVQLMFQMCSSFPDGNSILNGVKGLWEILARTAESALVCAPPLKVTDKKKRKKRKRGANSSDRQISSDTSPNTLPISGCSSVEVGSNGTLNSATTPSSGELGQLHSGSMPHDSIYNDSLSLDEMFCGTEMLNSNLMGDPETVSELFPFSSYLYSMEYEASLP